MDYTWGLPVGSGMVPSAWPCHQYPQQIAGFNPYHMSQPWTPGYMPMYPYGGYYPENGGYMQDNQLPVQDAHSPSSKRRRVDETSPDPIRSDTGLLKQEVYPVSIPGLPTNPSPVPDDLRNSSQLSPVLDSVHNVGYNVNENSQDSFDVPQNHNSSHSYNGNETTYDHSFLSQNESFNQTHSSDSFDQTQQRADSPPEADTSINAFGNQLHESLMVVLPDGSKTALMDLQLPTAPFANYQPPQQGTFVFSAPAVPSTGKATRSRRSSGSDSRGSGKNYCHLCNKAYESKYKLKLHMHAHTGERPFVCNVCGKGFSRGPNLTAHMRVHTGAKPFSCTRCNRGFSHPSDRIIHMVTEVCLRAGRILRKVTDGWECTVCDSGVMEDKEHAERHARQHEAGRGVICPVCRTSYQGQKAHVLVKHVRENHPEYLVACGV